MPPSTGSFTNSSGVSIGSNAIQQEKDWCDLKDDEKIERTRAVVKKIQYDIERLFGLFNEMKVTLSNHNHNNDGDVSIPIHTVENMVENAAYRSDIKLSKKNGVMDELGKTFF